MEQLAVVRARVHRTAEDVLNASHHRQQDPARNDDFTHQQFERHQCQEVLVTAETGRVNADRKDNDRHRCDRADADPTREAVGRSRQ